MLRDEAYDQLCDKMLAVFPREPPMVITDESWGDYDDARRAFLRYGSNWPCEAILHDRSAIRFVNDAAFLFLLPRFIDCALADEDLDADIFDYVVLGLFDRIERFSVIFSPEQVATLLPVLQHLFTGMSMEFGDLDYHTDRIRQIVAALSSYGRDQTPENPK
jgi:hypothetical protein